MVNVLIVLFKTILFIACILLGTYIFFSTIEKGEDVENSLFKEVKVKRFSWLFSRFGTSGRTKWVRAYDFVMLLTCYIVNAIAVLSFISYYFISSKITGLKDELFWIMIGAYLSLVEISLVIVKIIFMIINKKRKLKRNNNEILQGIFKAKK